MMMRVFSFNVKTFLFFLNAYKNTFTCIINVYKDWSQRPIYQLAVIPVGNNTKLCNVLLSHIGPRNMRTMIAHYTNATTLQSCLTKIITV